MSRKSKRELERTLDDLETGPVDVPPLEVLMMYDAKRAAGEVDDPMSDEEFNALWQRSWEQHNGDNND